MSLKGIAATRAKDLYISPFFKKNYAYARSLNPDKIFILSAKYGLVEKDEVIAPYDLTLNTMNKKERSLWAERVVEQLKGKVSFKKDEAIFLAGEKYREDLFPLFTKASAPLQGLGIGRQLQWLDRAVNKIND